MHVYPYTHVYTTSICILVYIMLSTIDAEFKQAEEKLSAYCTMSGFATLFSVILSLCLPFSDLCNPPS